MADEKETTESVEKENADTRNTSEQGVAGSNVAVSSKPKTRLIFILSGVAIALVAILVSAYFFFTSANTHKPEEIVEYTPSYFPLPDIKLRMHYLDKSIGYIVIGLTLRIPESSDPTEYKKREPEILDTLHTFIGSLCLDDFTPASFNRFSTPVGLERVRQNIMVRLNTILAPLKVDTILFRKLITQ